MENNTNYTLALESRPNSYEPIYIFPTIKNIDDLTKNYTFDDFSRMLINNYYIDQDDYKLPFTILYKDNGVRKVKEGVIYKDEYNENMVEYIKNFMVCNKDNANIINQIYQNILNRKDISENSKNILHVINNSRKNNNYELNLNMIEELDYYDIRTIYLYIIRVLLPKVLLNENVKLTRRIEN